MARTTLWLPLAGAAAAATVAAALHPVRVIELENAARDRTARFAVGDGEVFSVTSRHSMYDQPVTEHFVAGADGRVTLAAVSSPSAAVREYFGLTEPGERHAVERAMLEVVFRVAAGTPQRLRLAGVERSFLEFGDHGDRLVLRVARRPAVVAYLPQRLGGAAP